MSENFSSKRIAKNSIYLYVRMLFTMWLNLWATRLVLQHLGIDDMGVYGVVGGIVGLLSVFTAGITSAIQRFVTYEAGRQGGNNNMVFCSSLNAIVLLAVAMFMLLEVFGTWMLHTSISIPEQSRDIAFWVFQLSVITSIVMLIGIPYNALVIAHEKMDVFASISVLQVLMNWGAAWLLYMAKQEERLLLYAVLLALGSLLTQILYVVYCHVKFPESHYHRVFDWEMMKKLGAFTGISTTSNILQTIASQGLIFVINWTFGVAVNAVYAIALQLKNAVLSFGLNIFKAIAPQITKTYAEGDMARHTKLVYSGSKVEIYMILFIMLPFLFKTEYIMQLWLGEVPPYTVAFVRSTIFLSLTYAAFEPIRTAVLATNRIGRFLLYPECFYLLVLPLGYLVSRLTGSPALLIVTIVGMDIAACILRTFLAAQVSSVTIGQYCRQVMIPALAVAITDTCACYALTYVFPDTLTGLAGLLVTNSICMATIIAAIGLTHGERNVILRLMRNR